MECAKEYDAFLENGYVGPLKIVSPEQAAEYKKMILEADERYDLMNSDYRCKSNVLFPWVDEISRNPELVRYVSSIIGNNFHCWDTLFWIKKPGDGKRVSFHQDGTYWNFDLPQLSLTAWFAFDDVTPEQGSIQYLKGSHRLNQRRHVDITSTDNLLMRGQTVEEIPSDLEIIKTTVPAGHVLLHCSTMIHGSDVNLTSKTRVAMGMIFVSTRCRPRLAISPESSIMIAGTDQHNHVLHDPRPTGNWDIDVENWRRAYDHQHANYYMLEQRNAV
jgi:ectoine hydroxylase-related dioxygenase (phytanoyl-CoA dioxygenase family)